MLDPISVATECPYCSGICIAINERDDNRCYVKACVEIGLECQAKMAAEIARLRAGEPDRRCN